MHSRLPSVLSIVTALLLTLSTTAAQLQESFSIEAQPQTPPMPRDRPLPRREGTAILKGRVVDGATGTPIPRARVRLMGRVEARSFVLTDDAGAFTFQKLPAGGYGISVEKPTYLPARYPGTGRTMRARMQPLVIREGEAPEPLTIPLYRAGAIAGRVLDAHGDPVEFVNVEVMRLSSAGRGTPQRRGGGNANDIGEFRIGRLEPGTYLVFALGQPMRSHFDTDETPVPQPLPTYYPGVTSADQALPIVLERGQAITGLDFMLVEGVPTVVNVTVVNADGTLVSEHVSVSARYAQQMGGFVAGGSPGRRTPGAVRMQLAPGEYVLEAHAMQVPPGQQPREEFERFGSARVNVGSAPLEATIVMGRGATATGRVIFEGTTPPPTSLPEQLHLPLNNPDGGMCRSGRLRVNNDWTFRVEGLMGTCSAPYQPSFGRWTLKSVLVNGEDLLTRTIAFESGQQFRDVQVVFTDRRTTMRFQVTDDAGQPTREYVAVVFPIDKSLWKGHRFVRTYVPPPIRMPDVAVGPPGRMAGMSTMSPGRPEILPLTTAGEYYVVAVDDLEAEFEVSADILERLLPSALRVFAAEGVTTDVSLRRIKFWDRR